MRRLLILFASLVAASPLGICATTDPDDKGTPLSIFDAALAQFDKSRVALRKWQYYQTLTTSQFDSAGKVIAKGTWQSIVRPGDARPLEYINKRVEGKISFFEGGSGEETTSTNPDESKPTNKPDKNQAESAVDSVRKYNLRDRYVWKRLPDEPAAGEPAYVIAFEPKPNQSSRSREERFFSLLVGKIWVSRNDFSVLKAEASLQSPCHLFWIIARVTTFQLTYEVEPARGIKRLLRLSRATAKTVVTFPLYSVRQSHSQSITKYEPRTPRRDASP